MIILKALKLNVQGYLNKGTVSVLNDISGWTCKVSRYTDNNIIALYERLIPLQAWWLVLLTPIFLWDRASDCARAHSYIALLALFQL